MTTTTTTPAVRRLNALIGDRSVVPAGHPQEQPFRHSNPYHHSSCPHFYTCASYNNNAVSQEKKKDDDKNIANGGCEGEPVFTPSPTIEFVSCSPEQIQTALTCAAAASDCLPPSVVSSASSSSSCSGVPQHCCWSDTSLLQKRHEILKEVAEAIDREQKAYAITDALETGIPLPVQYQIQEGLCPAALASMEKAMKGVLEKPEIVPSRFGGSIVGQRRPVSPALIIAPWNVPIGTIIPKLFVALLCGCNVIVKPSEFAPSSITQMIHTMHSIIHGKYGFQNVIQLVLGGGPAVGGKLVAAKEIQCVQFTGAPKTAALVAKECAPLLKPLLAECGGSNALIICHDADLVGAVRYCVMGMVTLNGQWCMGVSRVLIHKSLKDKFLRRIKQYLAKRIRVMVTETDEVGLSLVDDADGCSSPPTPEKRSSDDDDDADGKEDAATMGDRTGTLSAKQAVFLELGPLTNEFHASTIRKAMDELSASSKKEEDGSKCGRIETLYDVAEVWKKCRKLRHQDNVPTCTCHNNNNSCKNDDTNNNDHISSSSSLLPPPSYLNPSVIIEPDPETAARKELFGPVLSLNTFDTEPEAIRMANLSTGMLACFVFSRDVERAKKIGLQLRTGMSMVNSANFAFEPADVSMELDCDFWGSAGVGVDGSGAAVAKFFSMRTYAGVSGSQDHEGHL